MAGRNATLLLGGGVLKYDKYVSIMFHFPTYKFRVVFAVSWRVGGGLSNIFCVYPYLGK